MKNSLHRMIALEARRSYPLKEKDPQQIVDAFLGHIKVIRDITTRYPEWIGAHDDDKKAHNDAVNSALALVPQLDKDCIRLLGKRIVDRDVIRKILLD